MARKSHKNIASADEHPVIKVWKTALYIRRSSSVMAANCSKWRAHFKRLLESSWTCCHKNIASADEHPVIKVWKTALYIRLSVEYNGKRGDSLETQRQIMEDCPRSRYS